MLIASALAEHTREAATAEARAALAGPRIPLRAGLVLLPFGIGVILGVPSGRGRDLRYHR